MIRIAIYEDNSRLREGLSMLIEGTDDFSLAGSFPNCLDVVDNTMRLNPDLILMDIDMPLLNGIEGLKALRRKGLQTRVLMLTVFDDNKNVFEAIRWGANGYLLKKTPPSKLVENIRDAVNGGAPMTSSIATQVLEMFASQTNTSMDSFNLSEREVEVLGLLVDGYSYKMVGDKLFIAMDTVRSHIRKIYEKLQVNSKSEAVAKALKNK